MKKIILLTIAIALLSTLIFAEDFAVIVNKGNAVSSISKADLENLFLGKKTSFDGGAKANLAILKEGPAHEAFLKEIMKKNSLQFSTYWKKAVFTGTGTPPAEFASDEKIKAFVASTPGAIGYVSAGEVDGTVKKITIK